MVKPLSRRYRSMPPYGLSREQLLESNPTVIASQCHRP